MTTDGSKIMALFWLNRGNAANLIKFSLITELPETELANSCNDGLKTDFSWDTIPFIFSTVNLDFYLCRDYILNKHRSVNQCICWILGRHLLNEDKELQNLDPN
jgi:hypothetical protein